MNYYELVNEISSFTENTFATADLNTFIQQSEQRIFNTIQFPSLRKNVTGSMTSSNQYVACPSDFLAPYSIAAIDNLGNYSYLLPKSVSFIREAYPNPNGGKAIPKYYSIYGPQSANYNELTFLVGPTPDQAYAMELNYFFYPPSIVPGEVAELNVSFTGGSGYDNGTFYNAPLTGGSGTGATAVLTISGGTVTSCVLQSKGFGYVTGDALSYMSPSGAGTGFSVTVTSVANSLGQSWLGDNFDTVLFHGALYFAYLFMKGDADLLKSYETQFMSSLSEAKRLGDGLDNMDQFRNGQYRAQVG